MERANEGCERGVQTLDIPYNHTRVVKQTLTARPGGDYRFPPPLHLHLHTSASVVCSKYGKHHPYTMLDYTNTARYSQTQPDTAKHSTMCRQILNADW